MLNHQLTASISCNVVAAHKFALSSSHKRKGEEDGSDRRNEFHGRRCVDDFEVGWGILQSMQSSFYTSGGSVCSFYLQCSTHKGDLPFVASVFRFPANPLKLEGKSNCSRYHNDRPLQNFLSLCHVWRYR